MFSKVIGLAILIMGVLLVHRSMKWHTRYVDEGREAIATMMLVVGGFGGLFGILLLLS